MDRATPLGATDPEQGYLPGLEPPPSLVPPVPWLTLYDLIGSGPVQTRGHGAPLAQRLFVEVLTAVHVGDRAPEWITAPPITLRDLFKVFLAAASGAGEHFLQTRLRLPLPAADLVRMYFVLGRDRLDRVVPAQRFSRYLGFELRYESASFRRHSVGPPHGLEYTLTS